MIYGVVCIVLGILSIAAGWAAESYMVAVMAVLLSFGVSLVCVGVWVILVERKWK